MTFLLLGIHVWLNLLAWQSFWGPELCWLYLSFPGGQGKVVYTILLPFLFLLLHILVSTHFLVLLCFTLCFVAVTSTYHLVKDCRHELAMVLYFKICIKETLPSGVYFSINYTIQLRICNENINNIILILVKTH